MGIVYLIESFDDEFQLVCRSQADAEEMVLSLAEEDLYNGYLWEVHHQGWATLEQYNDYADLDEDYWHIREVQII